MAKVNKQYTNRESQSLDKYLQEIGRVELLDPEEEIDLARRIEAGETVSLLTETPTADSKTFRRIVEMVVGVRTHQLTAFGRFEGAGVSVAVTPRRRPVGAGVRVGEGVPLGADLSSDRRRQRALGEAFKQDVRALQTQTRGGGAVRGVLGDRHGRWVGSWHRMLRRLRCRGDGGVAILAYRHEGRQIR